MHDVIPAASLKAAELTFSQLADVQSFIPQLFFFTVSSLTDYTYAPEKSSTCFTVEKRALEVLILINLISLRLTL